MSKVFDVYGMACQRERGADSMCPRCLMCMTSKLAACREPGRPYVSKVFDVYELASWLVKGGALQTLCVQD